MFKDYLKAWFNYRNDKNVMSLKTLTTLKREIQQDLLAAFEMGEQVIHEHPDLFDTSSSFVDFLFRLIDVSPPKQQHSSFAVNKNDSDTIRNKLDNINTSVNEIVTEHKRLIGEVDKTYKTNREAYEKGEKILTDNLEKLSSIVAEFNEHFNIIKRMTDNFKQKIQNTSIGYPDSQPLTLSSTSSSSSGSLSIGETAIPLSDSKAGSQEGLEDCERKLKEKETENDQLKGELNDIKNENINLNKNQKQLNGELKILLDTLASSSSSSPAAFDTDFQTDILKKIKLKILNLQEQNKKCFDTELEKHNDQIDNLKKELDAVNQKLLSTLQQKNEHVKMENINDTTHLQNKISELEKEISNKQIENSKILEEIKKCLDTSKELEKQLAELRDVKNKLETQLAQFNDTENKIQTQLSIKQLENENMEKEREILQNSLREKDAMINELKIENASIEAKWKNETRILKAQSNSATPDEFAGSLKNLNEKMQSELSEITKENTELKFKCESLEKELAKVQSDYVEGGRENQQLSNELDSIRQKVQADEKNISFLNNLLSRIKNYVVSHYHDIDMGTKSGERSNWVDDWIYKDTLYHRYANSLQDMFKKMFPNAFIEDFINGNEITEHKIESNVKTYEKLIESHSEQTNLLTSQINSLKAEIKKFQVFDPSVENSRETKRSRKRESDRQIVKRERSRSPNRLLSTELRKDEVEIIDETGGGEQSEFQNMDIVRDSIDKIYTEHDDMFNCMKIILNFYNNPINFREQIIQYKNDIESKISTRNDSSDVLDNIVSILNIHLQHLQTIEELNHKYEKCSSVLLSVTPVHNIVKADPDQIINDYDRINQAQEILTNIVSEHSEISQFINLFENYTTETLTNYKKVLNDSTNDYYNNNRKKLYLRIIDNFLNHETLVTKLTNEIKDINDIYTLKDLIYNNKTQTLVLSQPIITEITRLRSESEQRLEEINKNLIPEIESKKKRIDKLKNINLKLKRYKNFFLQVKGKLRLKDLSLMETKDYDILTNRLRNMINLYDKVQDRVLELRSESTDFQNLTVQNFMETFENLYQEPLLIRQFYAKYILKIFSFQQNLPIFNESVICVFCKNYIDTSVKPYRFQCHENHVFHDSCLETILQTTVTCPECKTELLPDMNYFYSTNKRSIISSPIKRIKTESDSRVKSEYVSEFEDELASKDEMISQLKYEIEHLKEKLPYYTDDSTTVFETSGDIDVTQQQQQTIEPVNQKWINIIYLLSIMYYKLYESIRTSTEKELTKKDDDILKNLENLQLQIVRSRLKHKIIPNILMDFFVKHAQIITNKSIELIQDVETKFKSEKEVADYIISNLQNFYNIRTK